MYSTYCKDLLARKMSLFRVFCCDVCVVDVTCMMCCIRFECVVLFCSKKSVNKTLLPVPASSIIIIYLLHVTNNKTRHGTRIPN